MSLSYALCLLILSHVGISYAAYFEPMPLGLEDQNYYFAGQSGASWGDFDSDGLLDLVATASSTGYIGYAKILRNNGTGFEDTNANIPQVAGQLAEWGDFDNDGDLDLLLGGNWEGTCVHPQPTFVIRNDGGGVWTTAAQLPHLCFASGEWADFDNDGYLDIGLTGSQNLTIKQGFQFELFTKLYRNEKGTGTFTPINTFLPAVSRSDLNFGDYDNDGWLDLALSGVNQTTTTYGHELSGVFRNDQGKSFVAGAAFYSRADGTITWADYNADGWLDLIIAGYHNHSRTSPILYANQQGQGFSETLLSNLEISSWATVEWGDYDNDGYPDFCYYGIKSGKPWVGGIYKNQEGTGYFNRTEALDDGAGVACVWGDYNNDGRLDLFVLGYDIMPSGGLYVNTGASPADPPPPPTSVTHKCSNSQLRVQWERPSEGKGALTYNVAVASAGNSGSFIHHVACMAMPDGRRLVPRMGNAQTRTFFILEDVDCSIDLIVKVQTIDASFRGSTFASSSEASSASTFSSIFLQLLRLFI